MSLERPKPKRGKNLVTALLTAALAVASASSARAESAVKPAATGPDGFRGAKLGMTVLEVRKHWKDMELVRDLSVRGSVADPASATATSMPLAIYRLPSQPVLSFPKCEVTARFFEDQLYFIQFDCGRSIDSRAELTKIFGKPTAEDPGAVYWGGAKTTVSLNPRSQVFAYIDTQLDGKAQAVMLSLIGAGPAPAGQPPAQPPAPPQAEQKP